jgi:general secretion pathway protein K
VKPLRQRGAALLAAMLVVTLVATLAAGSMWHQWRSVEVESAERSRVQSAWILTGALDWARLILREDARAGGADHLAEPWAVPLQEARLSTFLAADRNNTVDVDASVANVFLSGQVIDLQSQLNVTNLVQAGSLSAPDVRSFTRLFEALGLPQAHLARLAENLRFASDLHVDNRSSGEAALPPQRVQQLAWLGVPTATVAAIEPYVTILPTRTPVNLNTAPAEVLYAVLDGIGMADAQRLVAERERQHFRTNADAARVVGADGNAESFASNRVAVATRFFEVRGRIRLDKVVVEERSVVIRDGLDVRVLQRDRGVVDPTELTRAAAASPQR